jgi:hypothetical protein
VTSLSGDAASAGPATSPTAAADATAQGNVAELTQLLHDGRMVEMRTTYNGSYGASLMFDPREMTYYVALFQDKQLWRVIKSQDKSRAQMVYENFVQQTAQLADVELRRTELQAQKAFLERMIALQANRAQQLQADLSIARSQQAGSRSGNARHANRHRRCRLRSARRSCSCAICRSRYGNSSGRLRWGCPRTSDDVAVRGSTYQRNPAKHASAGFLFARQSAGEQVGRVGQAAVRQPGGPVETGGGHRGPTRGEFRLQRIGQRDQREQIVGCIVRCVGMGQAVRVVERCRLRRVACDRPCGRRSRSGRRVAWRR